MSFDKFFASGHSGAERVIVYQNGGIVVSRGATASIAAILIGLAGCLWPQSLRKVGTIELPGPKGQRFDYLTTDDEDHYLLSAHLGPGIVYVIDLRTDKLVKAIAGVPGITGLEYIPGQHNFYTSNWGENKIGVVDLKSMSVIKRLATAAKPNGSVYAATFRKVYVSDTDGLAVAIVDVDKDAIIKTLRFNSETGMPQYDSVARKVYVNLRRTNEIAEIDPLVHSLAVDSSTHRVYAPEQEEDGKPVARMVVYEPVERMPAKR